MEEKREKDALNGFSRSTNR